MQAAGNALAAASAGPPARPSIASILKDVQTMLLARESTIDDQLAQLERKAQTMETVAGKLRLELATAKSAALSHKKQTQQMVICILLLVACCACARCLR